MRLPNLAALLLPPLLLLGMGAAYAEVPACRGVSVATVGMERPQGDGEPAAIFNATFVKDGGAFERGAVFTWAFVLPDGEDRVVRGSGTIGRKRLTAELELGRTEIPPGDLDFGQIMERVFVTACGLY